ncbi:complement receptor type 1 isoform X2 [Dromaius novaehollandiae]|uniref:complement receptor type 1 isoform X2 n=1 Tax=Dromaius novaehollandiae TaxID=8790 RepID=UPI00311EC6CD
MDKFSYGSVVTYTCDRGYARTGEASIQCVTADGLTGVWSRPPPQCGRDTRCPFPHIQNGRRLPPTRYVYKTGDTVSFECNAGYALQGSHTAKCGADFKWSPPLPVCRKEVKCPQPPNIANGQHSGQSLDTFPRGLTVYYSCRDGYTLVGNMSINCTDAGLWSRPRPRCEAIGCKRPVVLNGKIHGSQSTYKAGETFRFDCEAGYASEDTYEAQCRPGGMWDPPVLSCTKIRPCPMPPRIDNGNHDGQGSTFFTMGTSVTYTCDPGYYLVGNAVALCRASGNWSLPTPRCEVTVCVNPHIENGRQVDGHGLIYGPGQTVTFQCHNGYSLQGSAKIYCQKDGSWDPPVPVCSMDKPSPSLLSRHTLRGGCGAPTRLLFAELSEEYKNEIDFPVGKTVTYTCRPGYAKHPGMSPTITCLDSGVWSEALEFCKRKQCGHPGEPENGKISSITDLLFGSTVIYSCEEGHRLIGKPSRRCEISDATHVEWSGSIPICQRIPCEPPPNIPDGKHTGRLLDEFYFGSSVTYSCDSGHPPRGEASIHCTTKDGQNGVWSGPPPQCGALACPPPPDIANGKHGGQPGEAFSPGASVNYHCDPGYALVGEARLNCTASGAWSLPVPRCEAGCNAPTRLVFAELKKEYGNQTVFAVGKAVEYVCRPGYARHPGIRPSVMCLQNRTWSAALEFCKRKQCANPEAPQNGRVVILTDLFFGSKVNYTCKEGHKLIGPSQRRCEVSGPHVLWSGDVPVCQPIVCDPPPDIPHGRHTGRLMDDFPYAAVVTYTCDPGHPLMGQASIFCTTEDGVRGVWSGPPPRCGAVNCPPPPTIANGKHNHQSSDKFLPGMTVQYTCRNGYSLIGNASINCTALGTWSRPRPRCEATGCKRPEIENGRITGLETMYKLMDTVVFECNFGYALKGSQESRCQFGGTWDPPVPICEKMLLCPSPPSIKNGQHHGKNVKVFIPGMSVKYHCDPGYALTGTTQVSCLPSGTWSIPYPRCEVVVCTTPAIQNGAVAGERRAAYNPGDTVTFQCRPGYMLRGSGEAECRRDGRWAPPVPACVPATPCPPPPVIANATPSAEHGDNFTSGMSITYSCDPGFSLIGDASLSCTASGNWSLPYPRCAAGCGTPTTLSFAELNKEHKNQTEFPVGKTVKYTCRPGYARHPQMPPMITCLKNQTWSDAQEFCKRKRCEHPGEPRNGRVIVTTDLLFGSTVNYTCEEGYRLTGHAQRRCVISGSGKRVVWSGDVPVCQSIVCDPPPDIPHGRHTGRLMDDFPYAAVVTYTCDPGYPLTGEDFIFCTTEDGVHGVWSGPPPRCGATQCSLPPAIAHGRHSGQAMAVFASGMSVRYSCDPGYTLIGEAQLNCTSSGAWSTPGPQCEALLCPAPLAIDNGQHDGKDGKVYSPGKSVNYSCGPGYSLVGKATLYCTENGTWSIPYPRCEVVVCTTPAIQNGAVAGERRAAYNPGDTVTFQCRPGYMLRGSGEAECRRDGRWAPPVPACVPAMPCPPPPVIANAMSSAEHGDNFTSGMSITYSCDPGFSLIGDASLSCTASGNWSLPYPRCAALQCPLPPNIDKGKHNSQDLKVFTPGMAINYSCDPGYYIMGEASIYCTDSGNWSLPLPRCEGGCAAPPGLRFAELTEEYKNQREFSVGDTVQYTCQPGYMRHPGIPPTVTCLKNQTWSEALEFCKRKQCKYPEVPKNGRVVILTDLLFGSAVNHTCEEGHELVGQSQRRCEIFGILVAWSGAPPVCQKVVCPVPKIQNGRISIRKNRYTYEDTVSFKCHEGFTLRGHHTVQCRADRTWDPPVPVCEWGGMPEYYHPTDTTTKPVVKCLPPPGITNGEHSRHSSHTFDIGALVHYSCKPGFFLIGNESIRCTTHGVWSRPLPRCEVGCASPGVGNGKVIGLESLYRPGDIVRIECNSDNGPKGLRESQCQAGGIWDPPLPICETALRCSRPPEIANGWHSGLATAVFAPGISVSYSCEPGFSLIGTTSMYCTEAGAWSHPAPVCQVVKCLHPPNITNGKLTGHISDTFPYGTSVSYSCNPGYSLTGNAFLNCTVSGTWSQPLPRCEEIRCIFPEVLGVKKTMMGNTYRLGANITLECDDGYMLEGISQIQCQEDFSWDPPVPACRLASQKSRSVGLGVTAAAVLLLVGVGIVWKIISKQKEGYYHTYENYGYRTPVDHITEQKSFCVP